MGWRAVVGRGRELGAIARVTELAGDGFRTHTRDCRCAAHRSRGWACCSMKAIKAREAFQSGFEIQCIEPTPMGNIWLRRGHCQRIWFRRGHCQRGGQALCSVFRPSDASISRTVFRQPADCRWRRSARRTRLETLSVPVKPKVGPSCLSVAPVQRRHNHAAMSRPAAELRNAA